MPRYLSSIFTFFKCHRSLATLSWMIILKHDIHYFLPMACQVINAALSVTIAFERAKLQISIWKLKYSQKGAAHKVRHARGGPRSCDSLWQGEGVTSMWRPAYTNFYHTYETWNLKWCLTCCCNICIVTEGGTDKNQPGQNPRTKSSANNWNRICTADFCPGFLY